MHRETFVHRHLYTQRFLHKEGNFYIQMLYTKRFFARINKGTQAFLHTEPLPQRNLCTEQFLHTDFLAPKKINTEKIVHTDCTKKNAHRLFCTQKLYPEQFVPSSNSSAQKPFRTYFLNAQQLLQTDGFYTESFPHRSLTHRRFYAQQFFYIQRLLYTDAFTRKTNCTQKLVHTAHFYMQPVFTQRGFVSPS